MPSEERAAEAFNRRMVNLFLKDVEDTLIYIFDAQNRSGENIHISTKIDSPSVEPRGDDRLVKIKVVD